MVPYNYYIFQMNLQRSNSLHMNLQRKFLMPNSRFGHLSDVIRLLVRVLLSCSICLSNSAIFLSCLSFCFLLPSFDHDGFLYHLKRLAMILCIHLNQCTQVEQALYLHKYQRSYRNIRLF